MGLIECTGRLEHLDIRLDRIQEERSRERPWKCASHRSLNRLFCFFRDADERCHCASTDGIGTQKE